MGRLPKPTALKLLEGNRGHQRINKQEPDPAHLNTLSAPAWLPPGAKAVWDEVVPKLRAARMLSTVDVPMLASGCVAVSQYRLALAKLGDQLAIDGAPMEGDGNPVVKDAQLNQWMVAQSMAFKQAMAVFAQFGMSPATRACLATGPQDDLFNDGKGKKYD